ncbi:cytosolic protein [Peribacillus sp. B-H-3]|uniref:cytosolic protein n=1 Tax=Peribacillus sp. B-H-3 TaxID=3400420 RepID=UPI003B024055
MALFQSIFKRYHQQCETSDHHRDELLRTHYYKANAETALRAAEEIFANKQQFEIKSVSKEHGEVFAVTRKAPRISIIATVVTIKPFETAVDFTVSTEKRSLTGVYPLLCRVAAGSYEQLDKKLPAAAGKKA